MNKNELYSNGYGGFSEDGKEYIFSKEITPNPWSHILTNGRIGTIITNSGGGSSWYINSRENKLTTWSNDTITDKPSEIIYLEAENNKWSAMPVEKNNDNYETIYGFGYAKYIFQNKNYNQETTVFVCNNTDEKVSLIKLKNISKNAKNIKISYLAEAVLGVDIEYTKKHIVSIAEKNRLKLYNKYNENYSDKEAYIKIVSNQNTLINFEKDFEYYKNINTQIKLEANEEIEIACVLGVVKKEYEDRDIEYYKRELVAVKEMWKKYISIIQVETPEKMIDIMLNGWLKYQVFVSRMWGRASFYQSGGAYGFRDQLQDVLALLYTNPELVKYQILYHSMHQFIEGDVLHWWHPEKNNGIRTRYTDDLLWMVYAVCEYIKVTSDYKILDIETNYINGRLLKEDENEAYINVEKSIEKDSIYEHCKKAIEKILRYGTHGLLLIGSGDWNDGMNNIHGESVWLSFFMCDILKKFIKLCEYKKDFGTKERYEKELEYLNENIEKNAWDGKWYKRAYFENGTALGSNKNDECKIDSISQSWSVIADVGAKEKQKIAMEGLENNLIDYENKVIKLLTPAFNKTELEPGYIKAYIPGVRENGGQYTHAAIWAVMAETLLKKADKAIELYKFILPIEHSKTKEEADKYKVEPYVIAADIYGAENLAGMGGWTWYTGSASWAYKAGLENILGLVIENKSIKLNPCIPKEWKEYKIKYKYEETVYNITIKNPEGKSTGITKVLLNGKEVAEKQVPLQKNAGEQNIEAIM